MRVKLRCSHAKQSQSFQPTSSRCGSNRRLLAASHRSVERCCCRLRRLCAARLAIAVIGPSIQLQQQSLSNYSSNASVHRCELRLKRRARGWLLNRGVTVSSSGDSSSSAAPNFDLLSNRCLLLRVAACIASFGRLLPACSLAEQIAKRQHLNLLMIKLSDESCGRGSCICSELCG